MINRFLFLFLLVTAFATAQTYAPPAGQPGSTALHKNDAVFIGWATGCSVTRGLQSSASPGGPYASVGDAADALGKAQTNGVLSLGDGGQAVCTFAAPITNGPGYDFAVFENGFDDLFLELAFVEVSSDGVNFTRFPCHSLTDTLTQTSSFGATDATRIHNFAGKYRGGYGTPFDLQELAGTAGLDIQAITHVRLVDVVGSITSAYATRDSYNNKVNDPWPTDFASGGFDLDAVGVIHALLPSGVREEQTASWEVYPNPVLPGQTLSVSPAALLQRLRVCNLSGQLLLETTEASTVLPPMAPGVYLLQVQTEKGWSHTKLLVR